MGVWLLLCFKKCIQKALTMTLEQRTKKKKYGDSHVTVLKKDIAGRRKSKGQRIRASCV